jgi:chemotaxis protein CheZ
MAAPRKIFRIEEIAAARMERTGDGAKTAPQAGDMPAHHAEVIQALSALSAMMNRTARPRAAAAPAAAARLRQEELTRIAQELEAVIGATARATHKIITAAEEIDQLADNLSATLKSKMERDLVHDISDQVIGVFEACNFQDLTGQRIGKVQAMLKLLEDSAGAGNPPKTPAASGDSAAPSLHGPRLDSDHGHAAQSDIDAMFDS